MYASLPQSNAVSMVNVFTHVTLEHNNLANSCSLYNTWHVGEQKHKELFFQTFDECLFDLSYMCSVLYELVRLWPKVQLYVKLELDCLPSSSAAELRSCGSFIL